MKVLTTIRRSSALVVDGAAVVVIVLVGQLVLVAMQMLRTLCLLIQRN
jgi:hypothetical protein